MALVLADRVKETTTTTGTGTYTLAGAVTGFESFGSIGDGNTTYYCCTDGDDFEVGIGTYASSGTTLARTTILESSNSDSAVNWTSGTRTIFCTLPADKAVFKDSSGNVNLPDNAEFQVGNKATTVDLRIHHNCTNTQIQCYTGQLQITNFANDSDVRILTDDGSGGTADYLRADGSNGEVVLYHYGSEKLATKSGGVEVTGNITLATTNATVDGRDVSADGTKLDGIATSATANPNAIDEVSEDTSPQLGGALDTNGNNIEFGDSSGSSVNRLKFGASDDLQIYHGGGTINHIVGLSTHSTYITGGTDLYLRGVNGEEGVTINGNGAVELFNDNVKKLETSSSGVTVTGTVTADGVSLGDNEKVQLGNSNDLQMYHNTYGYIDNNTSHLYIRNNVDNDDSGNIYIQAKSGENSIICNDDSNVLLYFNNSLRINVSSSIYFYSNLYMTSYDLYVNEIFFNGHIDGSDNDKIKLGTGDDFQLYHDGTDNLIVPTNGQLVVSRTTTGESELQIGGKAVTAGSAKLTLSPVNGYGSAVINAAGSSSSLILQQNGTQKVSVGSSSVALNTGVDLVFEGSTADANETTLTVTDPTADRTITLPDATGTVILNSNLNFPFFQADGTSDTIALTADSKLPFTEADGTANNIPLTT